jgi:hypothetical protein
LPRHRHDAGNDRQEHSLDEVVALFAVRQDLARTPTSHQADTLGGAIQLLKTLAWMS